MQIYYLTVLDVRNQKWVLWGWNQGAGRAVFISGDVLEASVSFPVSRDCPHSLARDTRLPSSKPVAFIQVLLVLTTHHSDVLFYILLLHLRTLVTSMDVPPQSSIISPATLIPSGAFISLCHVTYLIHRV